MVAEGRVKRFLRRLGARRLRVALLAEEADAMLRQEIQERLGRHWKGNGIILRSGSPLRLDHLNRVDVGHAAAVLIPASDTLRGDPLDADTQTIKALLTLGGVFQDQPAGQLPRVVAEIQDLRQIGAVRSLYPGPLEIVAGDQVISRLIAKNLRNPGLSPVFAELLGDAPGSQIYITEAPAFRGMPIRQLAGAFPAAVLLGAVRPREGGFCALLNPVRELRLEAGDALVLLACSDQDLSPQTAFAPPAGLPEPAAPPARKSSRRRVLVLGWSHRVPALLSELASSSQEQFAVDLVSTVSPSQREAEIAEHDLPEGRIRVRHLQFDYTSPSHLRSTGPQDYDSLVLLPSERLEAGAETDSRTILGCLLLRELVPAGPVPQVLVELTDPENVPLLEGRAGEVILSPVIISNLLARVALRRELSAVFDALFGAGGSEILFRTLGDYGLEPGEYAFADLRRASDLRGEIAIGLRRSGEEKPIDGGVRLNPGREERLQLAAGDQLIVLGARV
jgi:Trk K+ transport system NAD-binding subunit